MNLSDEGLELIRRHEGLRLNAYQDAVGVWTIGYGHTGGVKPEDTIDEHQAVVLLGEDVREAEECIAEHVTVDLTQGQFDALVSFVFNLGCAAFKRSTLLRLLNEGDVGGACTQFARWVNAGGEPLAGLVKRRADEAERFLA